MKTVTLTPEQHAARLRSRRPITPRYERNPEQITVTLRHAPFNGLTAEERCTVLAAVARHFRDLADQADEERLTIAEELSA